LPGYASGAFFVSDLAAQRALEAFTPEGEVLELCAAPGGKTAQLAEKTSRVVSVELDAARITTLVENLSRLGIRDRVRIVRADARRLPFKDASTSAIVLDAPCSASGVARRRPDVWFRHTPETIARFARTQRAMLAEAWRVLAPGGKLLYIVCSLHPEETRAVVQDLTPNAECHWLWPDEVQDGFFCALIQKR
ncbi:MAG: RsmB/NOP family class I SAM-dependent RNA methyltransferase, partial [Zetaproteobacteria bacterium]